MHILYCFIEIHVLQCPQCLQHHLNTKQWGNGMTMRPKFDQSDQNQPQGEMPSSMERLSSSPQKVEKNFNKGHKNNHLLTMHWYFRTIPQNHHTLCILWFPPKKRAISDPHVQFPDINFYLLKTENQKSQSSWHLNCRAVSDSSSDFSQFPPGFPCVSAKGISWHDVVGMSYTKKKWACLIFLGNLQIWRAQ